MTLQEVEDAISNIYRGNTQDALDTLWGIADELYAGEGN